MAIPLTINGQVFEYPQNFDEGWGDNATGWAQAVTSGALYLSGGNFPLTSTVDFGSSFGIKSKVFISRTGTPSLTGLLELAKTDTVSWRNNANTADLALGIDGSDNLAFNGSPLSLTALTNAHIFVGNASNLPVAVNLSGDATIINTGALTIASGAIIDSKVSASAAIALTKLAAQTVSTAAIFNSSGLLAPSATTSTQIGYLSSVTSDVQAQINAIQQVPSGSMLDFAGMAAPTGWMLCDGSAISRTTFAALFAAIGTTWGSGNGTTTFNIPNMTRRVGMGSGGTGSGTIGNTVGNTGGEETHTLTTPEIPSHTHTATVTDPGHVHSETVAQSAGGTANGVQSVSYNNSQNTSPQNTITATTGISVANANTGGGGSHNNIQPSAIVLKIIKT